MGLNGIDISSWQDDLVVSTMTTCDFVIVKATDGAEYSNERFRRNADETLAAGKLLGCYRRGRTPRLRSGSGTRERPPGLRNTRVLQNIAVLNQVRTDKGKPRVAIANQLRQSILVFRNLEEAANLLQGRHRQQPHPAPLLYSLPAHAIRLLVAD